MRKSEEGMSVKRSKEEAEAGTRDEKRHREEGSCGRTERNETVWIEREVRKIVLLFVFCNLMHMLCFLLPMLMIVIMYIFCFLITLNCNDKSNNKELKKNDNYNDNYYYHYFFFMIITISKSKNK